MSIKSYHYPSTLHQVKLALLSNDISSAVIDLLLGFFMEEVPMLYSPVPNSEYCNDRLVKAGEPVSGSIDAKGGVNRTVITRSLGAFDISVSSLKKVASSLFARR